MMSHTRLDSIAGGAALFILAILVQALPAAAQQGWEPVVATTNKWVSEKLRAAAAPLPDAPVRPRPRARPPLPHTKRTAVGAASAASRGRVVPPLFGEPTAPAPFDGVDSITTGSIDSLEPDQTLSPEDAARIEYGAAGDAMPDPMITGTVGVQGSDLARGYCVSIADVAADARIAWQKSKLVELEKQVGERIAALEAKTAEYKAWVERRDQFLKRVTETLVKIYAQMEPDAAALQLVSMDEETAAALLTKLGPQGASAILNEMQPDKAARLAATIAGAARVPNGNRGAPAAAARPAEAAPEQTNPREG